MKTDIDPGGLLYWTGSALAVGAWHTEGGPVNTSNMIYAKFGSVVGFLLRGKDDTWTADDVKYNPTGTTFAGTPAGYQAIPCWSQADYDAGRRSVSESAYQNVAAGKGDICKRVAGGGWRLPTHIENQSLAGNPLSYSWDKTVTPNIITFETGHSLPMSGLREGYGNVLGWNIYGNYWASSSQSSEGYYIAFSHTNVLPSVFGNPQAGYPIRCVRQ